MAKFVLNRKTCQMEVDRGFHMTADQIFRKVKISYSRLVVDADFTDPELMTLITKIKSGFRNSLYLIPVGFTRARGQLVTVLVQLTEE